MILVEVSYNKAALTNLVHEIDWLLHVALHLEGNLAFAVYQTFVVLRPWVVLLPYFNNFAHLNKKEYWKCTKYDKDTEKADYRLMVCHLLNLPIHEQQIDEFVLNLYGDVGLFEGLSIG